MPVPEISHHAFALVPMASMAVMAALTRVGAWSAPRLWRVFQVLSLMGLAAAGVALIEAGPPMHWVGVLHATPLGLLLALLVQLLGTVIGAFSSRYLQGEGNQRHYMGALSAVLASVQLLLVADHWLLLIGVWAMVGAALEQLLCFYRDRPFALLAAHKKRFADRIADILLLGAAALAWAQVGSGSLSALWTHVQLHGHSLSLQTSAVLLALAVMLRTASLPVHGWLIQVMEAPTPVSALLHAGVVNLGGFVLIRFAPLLQQASAARAVLLAVGLATAMLAGMVMLTRISIKVRLAWSTVAQMGFMLVECALGLYTLAALHLIGHSLYKAHAFLSASSVVRETRWQDMRPTLAWSSASLVLAPLLSTAMVLSVRYLTGSASWPWWWSWVLGLAWAPLLWLPANGFERSAHLWFGLVAIVGLAAAAMLAHSLPLGLHDFPDPLLGRIALVGMATLYVMQALLQRRPRWLAAWRRWSYAGFYLDEAYTRLTLLVWPTRWTPAKDAGAQPVDLFAPGRNS